jgi:hypothetical protein
MIPGIPTEGSINAVRATYSSRDVFRAWCEHCQEVVSALEPASFQDLVELGQMHSVEVNVPRSMVCRGCLPKIESGEERR